MRHNFIIVLTILFLYSPELYGDQEKSNNGWHLGLGVSVTPVFIQDNRRAWVIYSLDAGYQTSPGWILGWSIGSLKPPKYPWGIASIFTKYAQTSFEGNLARTWQPDKTYNNWVYLKSGVYISRAGSDTYHPTSSENDNGIYSQIEKRRTWLTGVSLGMGLQKHGLFKLFIDVSFTYRAVLHNIKLEDLSPLKTTSEFKISLKKRL